MRGTQGERPELLLSAGDFRPQSYFRTAGRKGRKGETAYELPRMPDARVGLLVNIDPVSWTRRTCDRRRVRGLTHHTPGINFHSRRGWFGRLRASNAVAFLGGAWSRDLRLARPWSLQRFTPCSRGEAWRVWREGAAGDRTFQAWASGLTRPGAPQMSTSANPRAEVPG